MIASVRVRPRCSARAGACALVVAALGWSGCSGSREVWREHDRASLWVYENRAEGPTGVEELGDDVLVRFRNRTLLVHGVESFRGTVSEDHVELHGPAFALWLDTDGLRIGQADGTTATWSLDQLVPGRIVRCDASRVEVTEELAPPWKGRG